MRKLLIAFGATIALVAGTAQFSGEAAGDSGPEQAFADGTHNFCADGAPLNIESLTYAEDWISAQGAPTAEEAVDEYLDQLLAQREQTAASLPDAPGERYLEATASMAELAPNQQAVQGEHETYLDMSHEDGWLEARFVVEERDNRFAVHETYICDDALVSDTEMLQELFEERQ